MSTLRVNNITPTGSVSEITVQSSLNVANSVTASFFVGDGSNLINLPLSSEFPFTVSEGSLQTSDTIQATSFSGSFSGSFQGDGTGITGIKLADTASSVQYNNVQGKPSLVSGSSQISYPGLSNIPTGIVSGSGQIDHNSTTNYVSNQHIDHSTVSVSAGDGLTGGGNLTDSRTLTLNTGSGHFTGGIKTKLNTDGVISGSSQVSYSSIFNIPDGIISGSGQVQLNQITGTTFANANFNFPQELTVQGKITAREFHTEFISSSIIYESGSTKFGDTSDDIHSFTGSVQILGSLTGSILATNGIVSGSSQLNNTTLTGMTVSGSFSGSFVGDGSGLTGVGSSVTYATLGQASTGSSTTTVISPDTLKKSLYEHRASNGFVRRKSTVGGATTVTAGEIKFLASNLTYTELPSEAAFICVSQTDESGYFDLINIGLNNINNGAILRFRVSHFRVVGSIQFITGGFAWAVEPIAVEGSFSDGNQVFQIVNYVPDRATQALAEAGTDNTKLMTPLRTTQAITAQVNNRTLTGMTVSGSFSGSFQGDGSNLTGVGSPTSMVSGISNSITAETYTTVKEFTNLKPDTDYIIRFNLFHSRSVGSSFLYQTLEGDLQTIEGAKWSLTGLRGQTAGAAGDSYNLVGFENWQDNFGEYAIQTRSHIMGDISFKTLASGTPSVQLRYRTADIGNTFNVFGQIFLTPGIRI